MFNRAHFMRCMTCFVLLLLLAAIPGSALAQPGTPPAPTSEARVSVFASDINDDGDIVGGISILEIPEIAGTPRPFLGTPRYVALLWRNGQAIELGSLPGSQGAIAEGINNRGQIVGSALFSDAEIRAVLWEGDEVIDLGTLPGYSSSIAVDINDAGQIIGNSGNMGGQRATLWEDGVPVALGELPGHTVSHVSAINDDGQVVGLCAEFPGPSGVMRAVLWDEGAPVDLGTLPGDPSSIAMDISNNGVIVGWSGEQGGTQSHGVSWENGEIGALTSTAGDLRGADAVNDHGSIVGSIGDEFAGERTALLLRNGETTVPAPLPGDTSTSAIAINASDQIVGASSRGFESSRPVLWDGDEVFDLTQYPVVATTPWASPVPEATPPLSGQFLRASANRLNDRGDVIGLSGYDVPKAVLWSGDAVIDLATAAGCGIEMAYGINNAGQIIGLTGDGKAVLCDAGVTMELRPLPGDFVSWPLGLNDPGQAVGFTEGETGQHPVLWENGEAIDLEALPGDTMAVAHGINNAGQIIGDSYMTPMIQHAVLWDHGELIELGTLPGDEYSGASDINDDGVIVGSSGSPDGQESTAVVWRDGEMTILPALPGHTRTSAAAINNDGVIVGTSGTSREDTSAVLWEDGTVSDLGTLPGDTVARAYDINESGQIVGTSGSASGATHAVMWDQGRIIELEPLPPNSE